MERPVRRNAGVGVGDVFLFFGWFKEVRQTAKGLAYRRGAPDLHVLFGWQGVLCVLLGLGWSWISSSPTSPR